MATDDDYRLLREDVGLDEDDEESLSDVKADMYLAQATADYPNSGSKVISAAWRVVTIEKIFARSTDDVDIQQNESSEKLGQIAPNKLKLLQRWDAKLAAALAAEVEAANPGTSPPPRSSSVKLRAVW